MTHEEFVQAYKAGRITVAVNKHLALRSMNSPYVAKRYRAAHLFWTWVWLLSIPAAIVVGIFVKWWVGVIVFVVGLLLPPAIKSSSAGFVLEQALEDEQFYRFAIEAGLMRIVTPAGA